MQVGWVKIGDFRQITGYVSKTVQDRHIISIKVEQEVVCANRETVCRARVCRGAWSGSADPFYNFTFHVKSPQRLTATANARDFKFCKLFGYAKLVDVI